MAYPCSGCREEVRPREEALSCDRYHRRIHRLIDGFNGMSTHLSHFMPKRAMAKTMEKTCQ